MDCTYHFLKILVSLTFFCIIIIFILYKRCTLVHRVSNMFRHFHFFRLSTQFLIIKEKLKIRIEIKQTFREFTYFRIFTFFTHRDGNSYKFVERGYFLKIICIFTFIVFIDRVNIFRYIFLNDESILRLSNDMQKVYQFKKFRF